MLKVIGVAGSQYLSYLFWSSSEEHEKEFNNAYKVLIGEFFQRDIVANSKLESFT